MGVRTDGLTHSRSGALLKVALFSILNHQQNLERKREKENKTGQERAPAPAILSARSHLLPRSANRPLTSVTEMRSPDAVFISVFTIVILMRSKLYFTYFPWLTSLLEYFYSFLLRFLLFFLLFPFPFFPFSFIRP